MTLSMKNRSTREKSRPFKELLYKNQILSSKIILNNSSFYTQANYKGTKIISEK